MTEESGEAWGNLSPRRTPELKARAVGLYGSAGADAAYAEIAGGPGRNAGPLVKRVKIASSEQLGAEGEPLPGPGGEPQSLFWHFLY